MTKQEYPHGDFLSYFEDDELQMAARYFLPDMFLSNYETIRVNMNKENISPNVVDIGCCMGFGSAFFLDGSYTGVDQDKNKFLLNKGKKNISYIVDAFPSELISNILKEKTLIASMSLGAYGELEWDNWEEVFHSYCEGMKEAKNIYISAPTTFTRFCSTFFGNGKKIGETAALLDHSSPTICPIVHIKT
jgi:hypothetical protein